MGQPVIAIWAWLFPELRQAGELTSIKSLQTEDEAMERTP
jgi:hypothetical protein